MGSLALAACLLGACGGAASGLSLSAPDNDPARLGRALAGARPTPSAPALAVLVGPGELRAVDLTAGRVSWTVAADVRSRVVIGVSVVAALENTDLVARAVTDGHVAWKLPLAAGARLVGLAADGDRVVYAYAADGPGSVVAAVAGGRELWRVPAPGAIGAPDAAGGLVYLPLQSQWLVVLDGEHGGTVLARVRRNDLAVSGVRGGAYGSRAVLRLADGPGAAPLAAHLPEGIEPRWFVDGYDPVQTAYSAFDRTRLLWHVGAAGFDGPVVALAFRALFAFDATSGALAWARLEPRAEVVSAEHAGTVVLLATADGDVELLDARTGGTITEIKTGARTLGAAFSAAGMRPGAPAAAPSTEDALAAIAPTATPASARRSGWPSASSASAAPPPPAPSSSPSSPANPLRSSSPTRQPPRSWSRRPRRRWWRPWRRTRTARRPDRARRRCHRPRAGRGRRPRGRRPAPRPPRRPGDVGDHRRRDRRRAGQDRRTPRRCRGSWACCSATAAIRPRPTSPPVAAAALADLGGAPERETLAYVADDPRTTPEVAARAREKLGR